VKSAYRRDRYHGHESQDGQDGITEVTNYRDNEFNIINPGFRIIESRLDQLARPKACPGLDPGARATRNW